TRPCIVKVEKREPDGKHPPRMVDTEGIFHRFGDSWTYAEDMKIPLTVAIVELKETGEVLMECPADIRFTDS
ncbi:MAG: hypothetical protein AAGH89_08805, partial [Verrucomicrobiota bacterium]